MSSGASGILLRLALGEEGVALQRALCGPVQQLRRSGRLLGLPSPPRRRSFTAASMQRMLCNSGRGSRVNLRAMALQGIGEDLRVARAPPRPSRSMSRTRRRGRPSATTLRAKATAPSRSSALLDQARRPRPSRRHCWARGACDAGRHHLQRLLRSHVLRQALRAACARQQALQGRPRAGRSAPRYAPRRGSGERQGGFQPAAERPRPVEWRRSPAWESVLQVAPWDRWAAFFLRRDHPGRRYPRPAMKVRPSQIRTIAFSRQDRRGLPLPQRNPLQNTARQGVHRRRVQGDDADVPPRV